MHSRPANANAAEMPGIGKPPFVVPQIISPRRVGSLPLKSVRRRVVGARQIGVNLQLPRSPKKAILGEREGIDLSTGETTLLRPRSAIIDSRIKIKGQIFSQGDLYLDGDFEGSVELPNHKLTVGRNGTITAEIKAQDVVVLGMTRSNIQANDRTEIRKGANFGGKIKTARIIIEDGVHFQGSVEIVKPAATKGSSTAVARSAKSARLK